MNDAIQDENRRAWNDPKKRELRCKHISEAQNARSDDMSRITRDLWKNDVYRKHQLESHAFHRARNRESWPHIKCLHCDVDIVVSPCRLNVTKFCNRMCQTAFRTGRPNLKNRGRIPSKRAGSGISGKYRGNMFRSLYELSFIINVLEAHGIIAEYETLRIPLGDGHHYVPDFVAHSERTIYEVKYEKALSQPKNVVKLDVGRRFAEAMGYTFEVYTEKRMKVFTLDEVVKMVKEGAVELHLKKHGGVIYQRVMKKLHG